MQSHPWISLPHRCLRDIQTRRLNAYFSTLSDPVGNRHLFDYFGEIRLFFMDHEETSIVIVPVMEGTNALKLNDHLVGGGCLCAEGSHNSFEAR